MAKSKKADKADKPDTADERPEVKAPGDLWWWLCMLIGLTGMAGAYLVGAGLPLPGG